MNLDSLTLLRRGVRGLVFKCIYSLLEETYKWKRESIFNSYCRVLPAGEYLSSRHEKASYCGFGSGTTVYDSTVVLGNVSVGSNCWIGPNTILDGSGANLTIGDNTYVSAGVHIYTHLKMPCASSNQFSLQQKAVSIGNSCYIGPNSVVAMGSKMEDESILGALSLLNGTVIPFKSLAYGIPAKVVKTYP